ncbi:hypothetical protein [Winogradskyella sp. KYW1333]|uniref:hypothetical protein n=1 Tax=Winogradskyella sp. KYW1333 TaxID=2282123 RepID=UPI000DF1D701|nr:hypothetical protein [Winogradskyella sp. KYW1333]RCT55968.1 hypothetical protein DUZ96_02480 [Winogradskyella sp. KYW1333]
MKIKLHLGVVMVILMFLGTYIEHNLVPNQQIVIQFSNHQITSEEANSAAEALKQQLKDIGAKKLDIGEFNSGQLTITYYSDTDVMRIQKVLTDDDLVLDYSLENQSNDKSIPEKEELYKFNVSEIQDSPINNWDFEGTLVTELNHKSDRYYFPKLKYSFTKEDIENHSFKECLRLKIPSIYHFNKSKFAHRIPQVRAGPSFLGNS